MHCRTIDQDGASRVAGNSHDTMSSVYQSIVRHPYEHDPVSLE